MNSKLFKFSIWAFIFLMYYIVAVPVGADQYISHDDFEINTADSVDDAVESIRASLEKRGFDIVATINHATNATNAGLDLRPTQLILFRKPHIDAKLIRRSRTAAIDLPQKILVWEDESGAFHLKYNAIGYLVDRHDIPIRDRFLRKIGATLNRFGSLPNGLITIESRQSVQDTVNTITSELENAGFIIPLVIDYGGHTAHKFHKTRPTQLIIFGNPRVGTQLMQVQQSIGIDLPQKFLVWEDVYGKVNITYNDPAFLASRHDIFGLETLLENIAGALAGFAKAGAGE